MNAKTQFDPREFRNALGTFTTGVTIITASAPDGTPVGITANSFNSVSLDPPMVLWSLAKSSRNLEAFEASEFWAVHILSAEQEALSNRFAKSGEDKFSGVDIDLGLGGVPLLNGCCTRMQCKTSFMYEGGDHIIFVGEVIEFDHQPVAPLVFQAGKYAVATRKSATLSMAPGADVDSSFSEDFIGYLLARAHFQFYSQIRQHALSYGLNDTEYFFLSVLSVKDGRSLEKLNSLFSYTGFEANEQVLQGLRDKGFVRLDGTTCYLTEVGRDSTLRIIAAAKALEADVLDRFGYWETVSLKNLLKQLIIQTDPGLAHPWDDGTEVK
ncbi:flavin reductase [Pseudomonas sp. LB3P38]|uniref:flavin reductase n=1 Tax=Pseudomonas lyxosi TaxID=3398358 RepID=UPI0039EF6833